MKNQTYCQVGAESLTVERLSDGSTAMVDNRVKSVHSLNPSATMVWDACAQSATLEQIQAAVETKSGFPVDLETIQQALTQLQRANLIESDAPIAVDGADMGRRSLLKRAGAVGAFAIPVVLTLTASEQRAYAFQVISGTTTTTYAPTSTTHAPTTTFAPTTTTHAPTTTTTTTTHHNNG